MPRDLIVDHVMFYQLIADPAFFAAVPAPLEPLRPLAEAARDAALALAKGEPAPPGCAGCGSIRAAVRPVQRAYGQQLAAVQAASPGLLAPLRRYVEGRRGGPLGAIVLHYQDESGTVRTVRF